MSDLHAQLAAAAHRLEPPREPSFDKLAAARRRLDRRRTAGLVVASLAGVATAAVLVVPELVSTGGDRDALRPASPSPSASTAPEGRDGCADGPGLIPNPTGDGSLVEAEPGAARGAGMPVPVWEAIVAEASVAPQGPRPAVSGERVAFGSYRPTQPGYVTNTAVPLPPTAAMYEISGQIACGDTAALLNNLSDGVQGEAEGWAPGAAVAIIDARPSFYQLVLAQGDAQVIFETDNMEHLGVVEDLRRWAVRVSHRLAGTTAPKPVTSLPAEPARWRLAASTSSSDTVLDLLVNEVGCASGRSAAERIESSVEYRSDAVIITVGVRPLDDGQSCPSNPDTPHKVQLVEPVGERALLDGGLDPPAPPAGG